MDQAVKKHARRAQHQGRPDGVPQGREPHFPVTIIREEIRVQSVRAKMVEPGYGWLRVSQFQDRTVDDFGKKLEELYKQDPALKGLVLDLRNDPGGLLDGAVAISRVPAHRRGGGQHQRPDRRPRPPSAPRPTTCAAAAAIRSSACPRR